MCASYCNNTYCSKDTDRNIFILDFGMLCSSFTVQNSSTRPTSSSSPSPAFLATSLSKSSKTLATEHPSSGPQVPLVSLHAQTDSSCPHSDHYLHAPLQLPLFCAHNTTALADPKVEFHSPYWNPVSDKAESFIQRLAALDPLHRPTADEALCDPWLANTPSHVDLSPTLRQNWSPRPKWRVAVTRARAANRFAAADSRSSAQSSGEWHEEQGQENEQDDLGQGYMPGSFGPVHQEPSLAGKRIWMIF